MEWRKLLQIPRDQTGRINWNRLLRLNTADNTSSRQTPTQAIDPLLSVKALRLAAESKGKLTVSQTAMQLNISLDDAQAALDECTLKGTAYISIDEQTGIASYCFPEFLPGEQ